MKNPNENIEKMTNRCGFVSIVGRSNAGKSTLLNYLVGEKISIVSPKVQTTRQEIRGIIEYENSQIIFVDTPGFCSKNTALEKVLLTNFRRSYRNSDVVLMLVDCTEKNWQSDLGFLSHEKKINKPFAIAVNKVDLLQNKSYLLEMADILKRDTLVDEIFMISALKGTGIEPIKSYLAKAVPVGDWLYGNDHATTDQNLATRLSEITREAVFEKLEQELPYSVYVRTDKLSQTDKKIKLMQSIVVMRDSQKAIVLGHHGKMIHSIRCTAITKMREIFRKTIELKLFVIVKGVWTSSKEHLKNAGLI